MQKTFIKYTFFIITAAIFLILFIHFFLTLHTLEAQQFDSFYSKTEQVIHILENNQSELSLINKNLDEDYHTRAKAAAYVIEQQKETGVDVEKMQYLANLLNVDELHVINENGIIVLSSVSKYIGIDMSLHEQTRPFLSILKSDDEDAFLIQDAQPNAAENKIMKYVGVARKGQKGIVQVGFEPTRQMEAEARNTYEYIFSKFPTDIGEELFAVHSDGTVLGHSDSINRKFTADYYQFDKLEDCKKGTYKKDENGQSVYVVSRKYDNTYICAALPGRMIFQKLFKNILPTFLYLLLIETAVIFLLNYLVKQNAVNGIHDILDCLSSITDGNFDTTVSVGGNPEFEQLSSGINTMVKRIVNNSDHISSIIEMSGIPLAAFQYEKNVKNVFVTRGFSALLEIPEKKSTTLYKDSSLFDEYIHNIMKNPVENEKDIFQINDLKYISIHMSKSSDICLGVVTDVTDSILERKQLQYENTHNHLTGLYKFSYFKEVAQKILKNMPDGKICAIVMIDLDFFKSINDTFGHDIGDRYLQSFSGIMQSMPSEHFVTARRSGDEFCMMIFDCDKKSDITRFLDHFYATLKKHPVVISDTESITISASCGFVCTGYPETELSKLLEQADHALYEMKRDIKGSYLEYH